MSQLGHYVNRRNVQAAVSQVWPVFFGGREKISAADGRRWGQRWTHEFSIVVRTSEAKGSSCKAAGARGGGREGSPRCSRILRVVSGGRIVAKMQSRPPHKWQAKTSAANTRFMSSTRDNFAAGALWQGRSVVRCGLGHRHRRQAPLPTPALMPLLRCCCYWER